MPSYFGPTNIPPLEAFSLGVPVIYPSDEFYLEQVGDAALKMDLDKPLSLSENIIRLLEMIL